MSSILIHELNEPLPVEHKEFGKGEAILVECGHNDYKWTCIFGRALISVPQRELLVQRDYSNGRGISAKELWSLIQKFCAVEKPGISPSS